LKKFRPQQIFAVAAISKNKHEIMEAMQHDKVYETFHLLENNKMVIEKDTKPIKESIL
jgi:hypothetical protein